MRVEISKIRYYADISNALAPVLNIGFLMCIAGDRQSSISLFLRRDLASLARQHCTPLGLRVLTSLHDGFSVQINRAIRETPGDVLGTVSKANAWSLRVDPPTELNSESHHQEAILKRIAAWDTALARPRKELFFKWPVPSTNSQAVATFAGTAPLQLENAA